ncbi:DUF6783 domain-containing protein [Blautia producta]|uniref:DUF6783 domain-containing protein n=1 Tax=Blautia producta TaxID=33035 RepID=UPI0035BE257D
MFFCSLPIRTRVCLKIAFGKLCVTLCGRFGSDEGSVAGYIDRIGAKYTAKCDAQLAGMNFQTHSSLTENNLNNTSYNKPNINRQDTSNS